MPGRGPAPSANRSRERDNHVLEKLEDTGELFGSPLPAGVLPNDEEWHVMTVQWWDALRRNPLLRHEPEMGWQFLLDTALMHHTMWSRGKWEFAAEIRLRVAKYGATPEDRMRLKIQIVTPNEDAPASKAEVTDELANRRKRVANG